MCVPAGILSPATPHEMSRNFLHILLPSHRPRKSLENPLPGAPRGAPPKAVPGKCSRGFLGKWPAQRHDDLLESGRPKNTTNCWKVVGPRTRRYVGKWQAQKQDDMLESGRPKDTTICWKVAGPWTRRFVGTWPAEKHDDLLTKNI